MYPYQTNTEIREIKWNNAVIAESFGCLIPYGLLMYDWARTHGKHIPFLASVVSHKRGDHKLCLDRCNTIEIWSKKNLVRSLISVIERIEYEKI